mgnify:CR=1 FL=1
MDYIKLRDYRNSQNAFANYIGLSITEIRPGSASTKMPVTGHHMNPIGSVHGGCLSTMADVTGGAAASSYGWQVTTLDCDLHYLRPGLDVSCLYGEARELKRGKRVLVYEVSVRDQRGTVLAEGIYSYMALQKRIFPEEEEQKQEAQKHTVLP